ncbi:hypothetical protein LJ737_08335 [Hymenobacter sp. 15J16-1T3B]|uniref:hypothetical protein n=1 Tax=Hymenobacter sp. 15J16-1T3B TaxID=2886941 RepID=UPI001D10851E|nr:hypothetical protein [Hymenobacter sp. 15J16-1T3B]MCC3157243.1 hypothetical protein [Hymenobacter sp. 15J16-1T3B]
MNRRVVALLSLLLVVGCEPKRPPAAPPHLGPAASRPGTPASDRPRTTTDTAGPSNPAEQLRLIHVRVGQLKGVRRWQKVLKRELHNSTDGGEAAYYYQKGRLAKIEARNYGETGRQLAEYYLWPDGQLAFVFETDYEYNQPYYQDSAWVREMGGGERFDFAKSRIKKTRSYFVQNQLMPLPTDPARSTSEAVKRRAAEQKRLRADLTDLLHTLNAPN